MKGVSSDMGAKIISGACSEKFNENKNADWNECVLEHMKGVSSDMGAKIVSSACYEK